MMLMGGAVVAAGVIDDDGTAAAYQQPPRRSPSRFQSHTPAPETLQPEPVADGAHPGQAADDKAAPASEPTPEPHPAPTHAQDHATEPPLPVPTPDVPSTDVPARVGASAPKVETPSPSSHSDRADRTHSPSPTPPPPDRTAPQTAIDSGPANRDDSRARFTFHASEHSSFVCSLDGAGFRACESGVRYDHLQPGWHEFAVRATDPAGNADASPARYRWHTSAVRWAEDQAKDLLQQH